MSSEETEKSLRSEIDGYLHGRLNALQEEVSRLQGYINRAFSDLLEQSARPADDDNTVTSAIAQYLRASHQQGIEQGTAQGLEQGLAQGTAQGLAQGIAQGLEQAAAEAAKNKPANQTALLNAAVAEIDDQRSQTDILNALINRAADFAPRAVFFIVRQDHAQGWRGRGLESTVGDEAARRISLSLADEHAVSAAARTQSLWSGAPDDHAQNYLLVNALGGDLPQRIAALPLVVRSRTVAVLYADSAALAGDDLQVEALETLMRVAGMAVELLAVTRGTPRPAVAQPAAPAPSVAVAVAPPPAPATVSQPVAAVVAPPPAPAPVTVASPPPAPTPAPTPAEVPVASPVFVAEKAEPVAVAPSPVMAEVPKTVEFTPTPAPPEPVAAAPMPEPPAPVAEEVAAPAALPEPPASAMEAEEVPAADADQPYYAAYQPDAPDAAVPVADAAPAAPEAAPEKVFSFSTPSVPVFETTYTPPAPVTYTPPAPEPTPVHSTWQWPTVMASAPPVPEAPPAPEQPVYQPPAPESYAPPVAPAFTQPAPAEPFTPSAPETFTVPPAPETFAPPPSPFSRPTGPLGSARTYGREIELPISVGEDERRLHNDARRFARLLVSEIKLYNEPKVREGRQAQDIYVRLRDAIDRSRQMYERRVAAPVASRFDYFHYELVNTLAEGDVGKLGADYPGAAV